MTDIKEGVTLELYIEEDGERLDPSWYCDPSLQVLVRVTRGERVVEVWAVGEMRLHIPYINEDGSIDENNGDIVRYTDTLEEHAKTDKELHELTNAWQERGYDIWHNNNWFEVVEIVNGVAEDGWEVYHDLKEAVEQAVTQILEPLEESVEV